MNDNIRAAAIALYDRFTHQTLDRRALMVELTKLAGGAAAAGALLASIAASPAAAAIVPPNDPRLHTQTLEWETAPGRKMSGYGAVAVDAEPGIPIVLVIHENRGLNEHIRDVARRVALAGYSAIAPDFLSPIGGTPEDEDKAREMIGRLDMAATVGDAVAMARWLSGEGGGSRKVGAVGFCWGGAMVNRLAVAAGPALHAGVSFYGPAPDPQEAQKVQAAMLVILAGDDERVNTSGLPWIEALTAAGKGKGIIYPGVNHAFHNDTSEARFDTEAARQAWEATLTHFERYLGSGQAAAA
jgi:carboxymethylenebutenolidase